MHVDCFGIDADDIRTTVLRWIGIRERYWAFNVVAHEGTDRIDAVELAGFYANGLLTGSAATHSVVAVPAAEKPG